MLSHLDCFVKWKFFEYGEWIPAFAGMTESVNVIRLRKAFRFLKNPYGGQDDVTQGTQEEEKGIFHRGLWTDGRRFF